MRRTDVGVHDNFFDLGGDSIQILRVRTEAAKEGLRFELRQMLEHPTIAGLAAQIAASHSFAEASGSPAAFALIADEDRLALPAGVVDAYPMTRLQAHMSKQCDREPGSGLYHDVATCHLRLPVDLDAFEAALAAVVHRHPILRSSFERRDPHRLMTCVHGKAAPTLTVVDCPGARVASVLSSDIQLTSADDSAQSSRPGRASLSGVAVKPPDEPPTL